jgi:hypothetical protein
MQFLRNITFMISRVLKYTAVSAGLLLTLSSLCSGVQAQSNTGSVSQTQFEAAIAFDFEGENGRMQSNSALASVGYPCGTGGLEDVAKGVTGRGQQLAGAGYNQVYNDCGSRKSIPNARIEFTDLVVDYYSISQNKWVRAVKQPVGGAAFAEDFVNNQATGADIRDESQGHKSVRSGIGNAGSGAVSPVDSISTGPMLRQ